MRLAIFYTPGAKETAESVYSFIYQKFGIRSADKFLLKADKTIALIAEQPFMFKESTIDKNVRVAFITRQCCLFYSIRNSSIHLLFFWDNRQEPI